MSGSARPPALSLEFEHHPPVFRPGEAVRGAVVARAGAAVECALIVLEVRWRAHGRGVPSVSKPEVIELGHDEALAAGEERRYPFAFDAPSGPLTYRGELVNVGWYVSARATARSGGDAEVEAEMVLEPWREGELLPARGDYRAPPARYEGGYFLGPALAAGQPVRREVTVPPAVAGMIVLFVMCGLVLASVPAVVAVPLVLGGALCAALIHAASGRAGAAGLGKPVARLSPEIASPGERVAVEVRFTPRWTTHLIELSAALDGQEVAIYIEEDSESGTEREASVLLHRSQHVLVPGGRMLVAGEPVTLQGEITIPADAAPSFAARTNEVRWTVTLSLEVQGVPSWRQELRLGVQPALPGPS